MAYDDLPQQQLRRIGSAGAPPTLLVGQLAYHQTGAAGAASIPGDLYIGDGAAAKLLVGPSKVWTLANFKLGGASAAGDVLTASNTTGDLVWTTAPPATVAVADPITGNGTGGTPVGLRLAAGNSALSVVGAAGSGALTMTLADNAQTMAGTINYLPVSPAGLRHVTGDLATLTTTDKDTLVEAINEIVGQITTLSEAIHFVGTYNVATNVVAPAGTPPQIGAGALPGAAAGNHGFALVVTTGGTGTGNAPPVAMAVGDLLISNGTSAWVHIPLGLTAVAAGNVSVAAINGFAPGNVQAALTAIVNTGGIAKVIADEVTITGFGTTADPLEVLVIDSGSY